jgi:uncharacterized protein YegL
MKTHPIINENSSIMFHPSSTNLPIFLEKDEHFGIISIKLNETDIIVKQIGVIFTIDCSQSMSELCEDKKSKMEHAIYTLQKILVEFANTPNIDIFVSVIAFDTNIYEIFDFEKITHENLDILIQKIQKIEPNLATNIEIALNTANSNIKKYLHQNNTNNYKIHHIQLTDGIITEGERDHNNLLNLINDDYSNIFVGFGIEHDSDLLETLSNKKNGDYRFIDMIEKSGLVYGEIIYNILYSTLECPRLVIENGKLYDWKNNSWENEIQLSNLPSGVKKEFQIKSYNPDDVNIKLYGICSNNIENKEELIIEMNTLSEQIYQDSNLLECIDLTKYAYRQLTQELLYEIKNSKVKLDVEKKNIHNKKFNFTQLDIENVEKSNNTINNEFYFSNKIKSLLEKVKKYMKMNNIENDNFMKLLVDDIYVCYKIVETDFNKMFITARQRSQGNQNTYTPPITDSIEIKNINKPLKLNRSQTICCGKDNTYFNHNSFEPLVKKNNCIDLEVGDNNVLNNIHIFGEINDSPYTTPKVVKLMRNVSSRL